MYWILDDAGEPVAVGDDVQAWSNWFSSGDKRHVAEDCVGDVRVSTVFLGLDHNFLGTGRPVLWETMVFGGELDGEQWRYDSQKAAMEGHGELLRRVLATRRPGWFLGLMDRLRKRS